MFLGLTYNEYAYPFMRLIRFPASLQSPKAAAFANRSVCQSSNYRWQKP